MNRCSVLLFLLATSAPLALELPSPRDAQADDPAPTARELAVRGFEKLRLGELADASADFTRAIALDPKLACAYSGRASVKDKEGDLRGALEDATRAIELAPKDATLFSSRGQIRARMRDLEGAIGDLSTSIEIDPRLATTYMDRGLLREKKGDMPGAMSDYALAIEVDPSDAEAHSGRGLARFRSRDFRGAVDDLSEALRIDPANDRATFFSYLSLALGEEGATLAGLSLEASLRMRGKEVEKGSWTGAVYRFLQGEITAEDLQLAAQASPVAERPVNLCRSYFYSGMVAWIRDDGTTAKVLLRKCVAMTTDAPERLSASAVLTWPKWSKGEK